MAFYVALGILVKFLISLGVALTAEASVVFSPEAEGLFVVLSDAGIDTGLIIAAVVAPGALLTAQATEMVTLHGQAVDPTAFPGGHWPSARSARTGRRLAGPGFTRERRPRWPRARQPAAAPPVRR